MSHQLVTIDETVLERMRAVCLVLPEAYEDIAFGAPTFKIGAKHFAMLHLTQGRTSVWCKAERGMQGVIVTSDPDRYFAPPYMGPKGWIAAWLDPEVDPDWDVVAEFALTSYRLIAPKRLVKLLDTDV